MTDPKSHILHDPLPIAVVLGVCLLASASANDAQPRDDNWDRPVVYDVRVGVAAPGDRLQRVLDEDPIQIPAGSSVELEVQGIDQFGRTFPPDRMLAQLETELQCRDLIALEGAGESRFSITAGTQRGSCSLYLWVPGNLNLEWSLRVEVVSAIARGYNREQAEVVVTRLYRAILGRDPEPAGLQSQTAEVLRGRLQNVITGMYQSREFLTERSRLSPQHLLEDLYRELLGRELDAEGIRAHMTDLEQRRFVDVALRLVGSEEFERSLLEVVR